MRERTVALALVVLAIALVSVSGCVPYVARYRYLSFEQIPVVKVESVAPMDVKNLVFGSKIPIEYSLPRKGYSLRVSIDPRSYFPNATIALADSPGVRLVPRPSRGARTDRPRPCGSYDHIAPSGDTFEFSWVTCGEDANPEELVVAFDVVGRELGVKEEDLRFALRSHGVYWLRDSL